MRSDVIEELFRKYYNEALLYTLSLCQNKEIAEDIVQNAFYKALESLDDSITNFKAWLLTVCRNEYYTILRKRKHMMDGEVPVELPSEDEEYLQTIIRSEEYRLLYEAIGRLSVQQREAVTLYYFEELSIGEISKMTGKSESNVKVTLFRARESLRELMEV